jgi:toxin secretion/phage lysis holin
MSALEIKNITLGAVAAVGGFIANLIGGWDIVMQVLIVIMAVDYITGIIVAGVFKKSPKTEGGALDSRVGVKGLFKKGCVLLTIVVAAQVDRLYGGEICRTAVAIFYCANEGLSVLENLGLMGVPLPKALTKALEALKDKGETGE